MENNCSVSSHSEIWQLTEDLHYWLILEPFIVGLLFWLRGNLPHFVVDFDIMITNNVCWYGLVGSINEIVRFMWGGLVHFVRIAWVVFSLANIGLFLGNTDKHPFSFRIYDVNNLYFMVMQQCYLMSTSNPHVHVYNVLRLFARPAISYKRE